MAKAKLTRGTVVKRPATTMSTKTLAPRPAPAAPPPVPQAPPPAVTPAPIVAPPDAGYEQTMAGLAKTRDSSVTNLGAQRAQGLLDYGYNEGGGGLSFDPTNPFSQAAMLKRNFDQAHASNTTSYAASGQLYAGSLQNAQDETGHQELQRNDALQKSLLAFLSANTQAKAQAGFDYETGAGQAKGDAIARAPSNPAYTPITDAPAQAAIAAPAAAAKNVAYKSVAWTDSNGKPGTLHIYPDGRRVFVRK